MKAYPHKGEFEVKDGDSVLKRFSMYSGVPQGSVLGLMLYVLYTSDMPVSGGATVGTFADDTAIMVLHEYPILASRGTTGMSHSA
jgi:hypothetical protein